MTKSRISNDQTVTILKEAEAGIYARLKRMYTDLALENTAVKDLTSRKC